MLIITILLIENNILKINNFITKQRIKNNIKNNNFILYYQPIVNPFKNTIIGYESLLRFKSKKSGIIGPDKFIKELEENNLIPEISLWILQTLIKDYSCLNKNKHTSSDPIYLSMNIPANELENIEFANKLIAIMSSENIPKKKICIELTERTKFKNILMLQRSLNILKNAGFLIAIDDFGVDHSNLYLLGKFDFDIIKLDKFFINEIDSSLKKRMLINFLDQFSTAFDVSIVIEGVEESYQKTIINNFKNEKIYIQGYLYSKPLPLEEVNEIKIIS